MLLDKSRIYIRCMPTLYYGDNLGVMREHLKDASVKMCKSAWYPFGFDTNR